MKVDGVGPPRTTSIVTRQEEAVDSKSLLHNNLPQTRISKQDFIQPQVFFSLLAAPLGSSIRNGGTPPVVLLSNWV